MSDTVTAPSQMAFADLGLPENMLATLEARGYLTPRRSRYKPSRLCSRAKMSWVWRKLVRVKLLPFPCLCWQMSTPTWRRRKSSSSPPPANSPFRWQNSCSAYGKSIHGLRVSCLYGGSSYVPQLQQLKRGAHVVVGTPGRLIDHLDRGTLILDDLRALVLDEADEMLRMGFIDDVTRIAEACPEERQTALFSATMPTAIAKLARQQTRDPVEIRIKADHSKAALIRQRAAIVPYRDKIDALLRLWPLRKPTALSFSSPPRWPPTKSPRP